MVPPLLRSLDLFSGIGGITLALEGIASPVSYCDINPSSRAVLQAKMDAGLLPRAPVSEDVTRLGPRDVVGGARGVDLIAGGWPCQDLSAVGLHKGLDGDQSGLIREVFRLADAFGHPALFLENVPPAVDGALPTMLQEFVVRRGYEISWCVMPASAVGAPHIRNRFFCLITHPKKRTIDWGNVKVRAGAWRNASWSKPPKLRLVPGPAQTRRLHLLGNSVVPDCVRLAFLVLASGLVLPPERATLSRAVSFSNPPRPPRELLVPLLPGQQLPKWGHARLQAGKLAVFTRSTPPMRRPSLDIVLDPRVFGPRRKPLSPRISSPLVTVPLHTNAWATPRRGGGGGFVLTERMTQDLVMQLRFARDTPDAQRRGQVNPEFVEWMMGYPRGWTEHPSKSIR
jgi:hypothetical protein